MPPLASELIPPPDGSPLAEEDLVTACRTCGRILRLDEATIDPLETTKTVYYCPKACPTPVLLVTTLRGSPPTDGTGYRFGDWMVRNPADVIATARESGTTSRLAASPNAQA